MIRCLFRYSTDAGYIKLTVEISSTAPEAAGRDFSFSSLFTELLGFSFGFGCASVCTSPEGVFSSLRQDGVKGAADSGALAHSGWGRQGYGCGVSQGRQRPAGCCTSLRHHAFSPGSCPWIMGPWQWRAEQAFRRGSVDSDLCSHTGFLVAAAAASAFHARL